MGDFGKAIDVIDRCFVNLRKIETIPQNLESIASVRQFPESQRNPLEWVLIVISTVIMSSLVMGLLSCVPRRRHGYTAYNRIIRNQLY